jgi:hypothetical protein
MNSLFFLLPMLAVLIIYSVMNVYGLFRKRGYYWFSIIFGGLIFITLLILAILQEKLSSIIFIILVFIVGFIVKYKEYKKLDPSNH